MLALVRSRRIQRVNPAISVIVATRNRPQHIPQSVASILANTDVEFELLVVDQSDTNAGRDAVEKLEADSRLQWIETSTRGLSAARNIGVAMARAPIIAFTDDDCRVHPDWLKNILTMFLDDPDLSLLFGAVVLRPEDRSQGFAAAFAPAEFRELQHKLPDMRSPWGIGANMAIRRNAFDLIGTFDPLLGAGAVFFAGEEIDMIIRALAAGLKVVETPHFSVLHLGVRRGRDASRLMRQYGVGFGATFSKHVRLRTPGAARAFTQWLAIHGRQSMSKVLRGERRPGLGLLAAVLWGACRALASRLHEQRSLFAERT
jgi:glycosyltransferase involved in cell wall biosynthesis